ncbi:membrane protein [Streptomyces lavendulae subsp. lavendulae]|nr:membrane protein [Streptomyces lavendulae subsp. lavendulae]
MDKHEGRDAGTIRLDDPWYDALAVGWGEGEEPSPPRTAPVGRPAPGASDIYLEVQRSAAFQEVRSRYRRFVVPATAGFFLWYVAYVVAATAAPGLMARPVLGAVNVAMLAGLGQFLSTFLLTWAYARHARLRRDRAALDLRWTVFEQERGQERTRARRAGR